MAHHIRLRAIRKQDADLRKLARALLALVERSAGKNAQPLERSKPRRNREAEP